MTDHPEKIIVFIRNETFLQSLANDLTSITVLVGMVALNEATLQSATLNFLLGFLGILGLLGWAMTISNGRRIRGATEEEVFSKLRDWFKRRAA